MIRQTVILYGGLGTRLGALTAQFPKPLLRVGGFRFSTSCCSNSADCAARRFRGPPGSRIRILNAAKGPLRPVDRGLGALWHPRDKLDELFFSAERRFVVRHQSA
jgi:hypothetical protein